MNAYGYCPGCFAERPAPGCTELCDTCVEQAPVQPTGWDETTETSDDISWGAAYGDAW